MLREAYATEIKDIADVVFGKSVSKVRIGVSLSCRLRFGIQKQYFFQIISFKIAADGIDQSLRQAI